jgi:hypothetical protein
MLTKDKARRIAANIAKLPQGAAAEATGLYRPRHDLNFRHFAGLRSLTSWAITDKTPAFASEYGTLNHHGPARISGDTEFSVTPEPQGPC